MWQVSRGHALQAEVLQLSSSLPDTLRSGGSRFSPVLFDFRYFRDPEGHEQKLEASAALATLDEEFREVWAVGQPPCMQREGVVKRREGVAVSLRAGIPGRSSMQHPFSMVHSSATCLLWSSWAAW